MPNSLVVLVYYIFFLCVCINIKNISSKSSPDIVPDFDIVLLRQRLGQQICSVWRLDCEQQRSEKILPKNHGSSLSGRDRVTLGRSTGLWALFGIVGIAFVIQFWCYWQDVRFKYWWRRLCCCGMKGTITVTGFSGFLLLSSRFHSKNQLERF